MVGWGTGDKTYNEMMKKLGELIDEIENTRKAINNLKEVTIKLDDRNWKLQIAILFLGIVTASDMLLRIIKMVN